jgi:hypothetical protein
MSLEEYFGALSLKDIEAFVSERREEDLHLDFKLVNDAGLNKRDDRRTFATAVSGFANSDGGLIVWGIDARRNADDVDCAQAKPGISDLKRFLTKLNEFTGSVVNPTAMGVVHRTIEEQSQEDYGFAVTLVPVSDSGPHMAKLGEDRYYRRSGSNFVRMEHFEIADMFGRRPHPQLRLYFKRRGQDSFGREPRIQVEIGIENCGRGSARAPYLTLLLRRPFGVDDYGIDGNGHHGLPMLVNVRDGRSRFGGSGDSFIHPGVSLPVTTLTAMFPEGDAPPDLTFDCQIGCADQPTLEQSVVKRGADLLSRDD